MQSRKDFSMKNYLFISGTPRSGTTALVTLLGSHAKMALGIERFKFFYVNKKRDEIVDTNLFDAENFFNFSDGATNATPENAPRFANYYSKLETSYNECIYYGDKFPNLYEYYDFMLDKFPGAKFLFCSRKPEEVASSWNARAQNPHDVNWPEQKNYVRAVEEWNLAHKLTREFAEKHPNNLRIVHYWQLISDSLTWLENIYIWLDLDIDINVLRAYRNTMKDWNEKLKDKNRTLSHEEQDYLSKNVDYSDYQYLKNNSSI